MVQILDIEWLLSTLFDASLLSPSSRRQRRLLFFSVPFRATRRLDRSSGNYVIIFDRLGSGLPRLARAMLPPQGVPGEA